MIILLNGPPRSGKDTIADFICEKYGFTHYTFKEPLIQMVVKLFDIPRNLWDERYITHKDVKMDFLRIYERKFTPREALIYVAEEMIKPSLGDGIFAKVITNRMKLHPDKNYVISDLGFSHELDEVLKEFSPDSVYVFRIYRDGFSFNNDSRNYICTGNGKNVEDKGNGGKDKINFYIVRNNGTVYDLTKKIDGIVDSAISTTMMGSDPNHKK